MQNAEHAFYEEDGTRFVSSELTRGPWDAGSQHAGPPAALLARALERCGAERDDLAGRLLGRITLEILRPVPIAPLRLEAAVTRPGRRVEMVEATLLDVGGGPLVKARGWRLRRATVDLPAELSSATPGSAPQRAGRPSGRPGLPAPPESLEPSSVFFPTAHDIGYHTAMEYRFEVGGFDEPGPAVAWMRMRQPLVAGEEPTPLQRVLVAADSGNGISSTLDFTRFLFINVDLSVHLQRMPVGEWVGLDSLTVPEPTGLGISDTMLFDEQGPLGRANQTLLIAPR